MNSININTFKEKQNKLLKEIEEKNITINDLNRKLKQQIDKNNELLLMKEENKKLKEQLNKYNNDTKTYSEIKNILYTMNESSKKNINELINKDKQFNIDTQKINKQPDKLDDIDYKEILNNLNNYKEITNEYEALLGEIKNFNNNFEQINKNII